MVTVNENSIIQSNYSMEGGDIDRDRIVDGHLLPDEYFCTICRFLLWNPRSCASCQQLFCQKCIRTWLEYSKGSTQCPFRCQMYIERNCPPAFYSLLSKIKIQCRNSSFGCSEILTYDSLERHEAIECKHLTRKCVECMKLILVSEYEQHVLTPAACIPCPIRCVICQSFVEKNEFNDHFYQCYNTRMSNVFQQLVAEQTPQNPNQNVPPMTAQERNINFFRSMFNTFNLIREQRENSRLPTTLLGVDKIQQARERGCSHLYHMFLMIMFVLTNWRRAPQLIYLISLGAFAATGLLFVGLYVLLLTLIRKHIYLGVFVLMLLSSLASYGMSYLLQCMTDFSIILLYGSLLFCTGCLLRGPLEVYDLDPYLHNTCFNIGRCCFGILIGKITLLMFRFFFWCFPFYLIAAILTFINTFIAIRIRRSINNTAQTTV